MSIEESLKRKSTELSATNAEEEGTRIVQPKVLKLDSDTSKHNLKESVSHKTCENNAEIVTVDDDNSSDVQIVSEKAISEMEQSLCSINIKFNDKSTAEAYKSKFLKFLDSFVEFRVKCEDDLSVDVYRNEAVKCDELIIVDEVEESANIEDLMNTPSGKKRKKRSKVKKELFVVDANPSPNTAQTNLRYITRFTINTEKVEETVDHRGRSSCFNCGKAHALKDCPLPKDYEKINAARQKFKQLPKASRYHLEEDQKYSHLTPGKLSNELKQALGLHKGQAPHFVYLMRKLGYPPGWLEEAKIAHSNLDLFDIDGKFVKASKKEKQGLDPDKVVEYPGFNIPFEKGVKDEFRHYGVPPFSDNFSKEKMIEFFDKNLVEEDDLEDSDNMDIDHEQEKIKEVKRDSPSLIDLEEQKQQLLEELKVDNKNVPASEPLSVKSSCFGTPILKSSSPYSTLPNADNFSKDVSPVINFENLPNSTGKYEQMTDVLQKVRTTLKKMHKCNA